MQINYPKGRILVSGYFFKKNSVPQSVMIERIIESWKTQTKAYRHPEGILVLWEEAHTLAVDDCIAIPIIRLRNLYSNILLADKQQDQFLGRGDVLCLVLEGVSHVAFFNELEKFDPAVWLDVTSYPLDALTTLGFVPPAKDNTVKAPKKIRDLLDNENLLESDAQIEAVRSLTDPSVLSSVNKKPKTPLSIFMSALKKAFFQHSKTNTGSTNSSDYGKSLPAKQSLLSKLRDSLQNHFMASKLGQLIGQRQAEYIQEMMEKFAGDDLLDALRHAIPLSNIQDAINSTRAAVGRPGIRQQLSISPNAASGASGSYHVGDQVMHHMRQLYLKAFTRLDKENRFEEAAFVLAELLRDIDRAVKYLEEHGQLKLAAELAEGQRLSPARIVRQWIIAGDIERALHIAMIASCYQEAITLLESNHKIAADKLRWHCAQLHLKAGDYATAIDIAWPLEKYRHEVLAWLQMSVGENSELSAVHWVRLILLDSNQWQQHIAQFADLLKKGSPQLQSAHFLMIDEILKAAESPASKLLSDLMARSYLRLVASRKLSFHSRRWQKLTERAGDQVLRADCRKLNFKHILESPSNTTINQFHFEASHGRKVSDAVRLSNGYFLLAFGESGVELYDQKGKLISRFSEPCHSIVLSDFGNQALFIAQRSGYQMISRFTLATKQVVACFDTSLNCWASSFDGMGWFVAKDNCVWLLDIQASSPTVIWSIDEPNRTVIAFERTPHNVSIVFQDREEFELWRYSLPNLFLRERSPLQKTTLSTFYPVTFNGSGVVAGINPADGSQFAVYPKQLPFNWCQIETQETILGMKLSDSDIIVFSKAVGELNGRRFSFENGKIGKQLTSFCFQAADSVLARVIDNKLIVVSVDGRVIEFNLATNLLESDFVV